MSVFIECVHCHTMKIKPKTVNLKEHYLTYFTQALFLVLEVLKWLKKITK